jgi:O-antigen/teichoic acid export membrane protein
MKLVTLMSIPSLLYGQVVSAFISELYTQGRRALLERMLRSVANLTTAVTGIFAVILLFWGEEVLGLVYGDYYRTGNLVLALLVIAQLINVVTGPCGQLLLMTGFQQSFFKITFIAGGLAIGVSFWLIRPFGYLGAAIGQMTYTIVTTILAAYLGYRLTGVKSWVGWYRERK